MDKRLKGDVPVYPDIQLTYPTNALVACCWRAPEGDFGVTCFTPTGERVWRLRNLTHDAAESVAHRYWRWLDLEGN
jgi:hypothetical protein